MAVLTPLAECSEFIDAFLRSVGVEELEGVEPPFTEPRSALPGRGVLGDRLVGALKALEVPLCREGPRGAGWNWSR